MIIQVKKINVKYLLLFFMHFHWEGTNYLSLGTIKRYPAKTRTQIMLPSQDKIKGYSHWLSDQYYYYIKKTIQTIMMWKDCQWAHHHRKNPLTIKVGNVRKEHPSLMWQCQGRGWRLETLNLHFISPDATVISYKKSITCMFLKFYQFISP